MISALVRSALRRRSFRFLLIGGINTLFGYAVFASGLALGLSDSTAALISTLISPFFNFLTTGTFVFADRDPARLLRFLLVYALGYCLVVLELRCGRALELEAYVTGALVMLPNAALTFWLQQRFVFRVAES